MTTRTTARRVAAAALVLLLAGCTSGESQPLTVSVTRTDVTSTVTATGSLQAITEQSLGFQEGGKLVEVNVAVGQQVEPGQVLARVDDFAARQDLAAAEAQVAQQQAALNRIRNGNDVNAAEDDVTRAQEVLDATEEQAEAVDDADEAAVEQAKKQLKLDKDVLDDTKSRTRASRRACNKTDRRALEEGAEDRAGHGSGDSHEQEHQQQPQGRSLLGGLTGPSQQEQQSEAQAQDCQAAAQAEAEVEAAERQVRASRTALDQAENQRRVDRTQQDLAIENARRDLTASRNEAESARGDRPYNIDEQAAAVQQLQADVERARRAIEDAVLRAPVAGKVASINGVVGEFLGSGGATTPLAPGGTVPLPERGSGVSGGEQMAGGQTQRPGGSSFIVLSDVQSFQIVAPFAETDAALLEPNQAVEVTFDAVPDLSRSGSVVSVAPTGTDISGVTSYYAVVVLNELDPRLKDGQTASAEVVVDDRRGVLAIPNAALMQSGQSGTVTVLQPDGTQQQVQVELGLAGDAMTEVRSGLREGDRVLVAPAG